MRERNTETGGSERDARAENSVNRPIRRVAFVAMLMFALLFANGTYVVLFQQARSTRTG